MGCVHQQSADRETEEHGGIRIPHVEGVVFCKLDNSEDTGEGNVWLFVLCGFDDMWCLGGWMRNGP